MKQGLQFLIIFLITFPFSLFAQTAPTVAWDKTFGGNSGDHFTSIEPTSDGGFILGGTSYSVISGDKSQASKGGADYWIVKVDANGNRQWDKTFGGNLNDYLQTVKQTPDGGFVLAGESTSGVSGDKSEALVGVSDWWVLKIDAAGNKLWDKTIWGNFEERFSSLQLAQDGSMLLGGSSNSPLSDYKSEENKGPSSTFDYWVVKLDSNGNKIWDKTIGGSVSEELFALQATVDGGYILGGLSSSNISGDKSENNRGVSDYWIVKIDVNGNKTWDKTFGGDLLDVLTAVYQTSDGGYIVGGYTETQISGDKTGAGKGMVDFWILRMDAAGNKLWDRTFGTSQMDILTTVQPTPDGGFVLAGRTNSEINGDKTEPARGQSMDCWIQSH